MGALPTQPMRPTRRAAPRWRQVWLQALLELRLMFRNGEQVVLTSVIPLVLLLGMSKTTLVSVDTLDPVDTERIDIVVPGVLALCVISSAFTLQAIATGYERRYGVLKFLGATPLRRGDLLVAKTAAVLALIVLQLSVVMLVGQWLGWAPTGSWLAAFAFVVLGTAAFSGLALLLAGTLRAEATLAAANLIFLLLLLGGAVVIPLESYPEAVQGFIPWLPSAAFAEGLRNALTGAAFEVSQVFVLLGWTMVTWVAAARTFRWE